MSENTLFIVDGLSNEKVVTVLVTVNEFESFNAYKNRRGVMYIQHSDSRRVIAKVCTDCKEWHFMDGFNYAKKGFAGKHSLCRGCHKKNGVTYRKKRYEAHHIELLYQELQEQRAREDGYVTGRSLMNW